MVALFKDRSPVTIIWLFLLSFFVHGYFFIELPKVIATQDDGILSLVLIRFVAVLNPLILIFLYHIIVLLQALRLNFLFTDNRMFSRSNYLTAMAYILLTAIFKEWGNLTPSLIANSMVIWFFVEMVRLYNNANPKTLIFNIGLITGVSILLYQPCTVLIPLALFALLIVRPFFIAEWIVLLMGVLSPFYFLFSYLYLTDRWSTFKRYIPEWQINLPHVQSSVIFFITIGIIAVILFIGLLYWQSENRRLLIHVRKNWIVFQAMILVLLPLPFITKNAGLDVLLLFIVPLSPFFAKGFLTPKKETLPNIMFWTLILLIVVNNWAPILKY